MATRQFQARKKAELHNSKLKNMLQAQVRVAEDLLRVLRQAHMEVPGDMALTRLPMDTIMRMSRDEQLIRLSKQCEQWADAFARSSKFENERPLRFYDVEIIADDGITTLIELSTSQVVPFSTDRVEEVMWGMLKGEQDDERSSDEKWEPSDSTDDTLTVSFTSTSTIDDSPPGTMSGTWVAKRFHSSDKTSRLIVSHSYTEPYGFHNELDTACIDEASWSRLVDSHTLGHTHLPPPLTVIQHVRRSTIAFGQRGVTSHYPQSRMEALTQWYASQIQEEVSWAQQTLENTLMDETLKIQVKQEGLL